MLVKRLGAAFPKSGSPDAQGSGTYANGIAVLTDFLKTDVGIKGSFVLENGSGLATENRLSARQVVDVLAYMEKRMEVFPEFLASLPATGWDGTLKKRFGAGDAGEMKGLFRAKSGTLTEPVAVAALAGYFRHPKHGLTAFCILENGNKGETQPAITDLRDKQDQVLVAFMNNI
jgi:D-alanyl-D-alanine carboxypeptidase/D-alanyl-D-alanine-endopeptidase (penicillin-binding protein 4)